MNIKSLFPNPVKTTYEYPKDRISYKFVGYVDLYYKIGAWSEKKQE